MSNRTFPLGNTIAAVAVGLLLAAVLVPRLLTAEILEDMSRQQMNLKVVALALGAYAADEGDLPPDFVQYHPTFQNVVFPGDYLTTPVDYLMGQEQVLQSVLWPDGRIHWFRLQGLPGISCGRGTRWDQEMCHPVDFRHRTDQYLNCSDFAGLVTKDTAYLLWASGPSGQILGSGPCSQIHPAYHDVPYDPTNGLMSNGHLFHFGTVPQEEGARSVSGKMSGEVE